MEVNSGGYLPLAAKRPGKYPPLSLTLRWITVLVNHTETKTYSKSTRTKKTIYLCDTINQHWILIADYKFQRFYIWFLLVPVWAAFALYFHWIPFFFCRASSASSSIDELRFAAVYYISCLLVFISACIYYDIALRI